MGQFEFYIHDLDDVVMCEECGVRPAVVRELIYPNKPFHMCLECAEREGEISYERRMEECKARWANYQCYLRSFAPTNSK